MFRGLLVSTLLLILAGCQNNGASKADDASASSTTASGFESGAGEVDSTLQEAIAGTHRVESNRLRDGYRHPQQTLEFFGIKRSMSVLEITPGGGWYSEILGPWLNADGHFIAAIWNDTVPGVPRYFAPLNQQLRDKIAARPDLYGGAKLIVIDTKSPDFSEAGPVDAIVTFRNVHNWTQSGNDSAWFKAFFAALKPGGVLGVVDHRAHPGTSLEATLRTGYLTEEYVIGLATAAGFVLEAKSEVNANSRDTKDYESGVWTLPPTLALKERDREKYLAIGESDRMTLRFRKPGGDAIHSSDD